MIDILNSTNAQALADPYWLSKQVDSESNAGDQARARALSNIERQGLVDGSAVAKRSYEACVHLTAAAIVDYVAKYSKANSKPDWYPIVSTLDPYQLAMTVGLTLMNKALSSRITFTSAAIATGTKVKQVVDADIYDGAHPVESKRISERLKSEAMEYRRQSILKNSMDAVGFEGVEWTVAECAAIGGVLVEIFIATTGLFSVDLQDAPSAKGRIAILVPTPTLDILIAEADASLGLLKPVQPMMLIPPPIYTDLHTSPYIDDVMHPQDLVKNCKKGSERATLMAAQDLSEIYASATSISQTAWRVNTKVLDVMAELVAAGGGVAGLPSLVQPELPAKPWGDVRMDKEEWATFKVANDTLVSQSNSDQRVAHDARATWASKRITSRQQLTMAEEYRDEVAFWYPVSVDWRGRTYTVAGCGAMSPQGDSRGKALLEFAKGTPLGPNGLRWLRIDAANKYGKDKLSLADRQQWAIDNLPMILSVAFDPKANTDWQEADDAFGFLASCFELAGAAIEGEDFVSHLSVNVDATQSGMQIYSGLLKDTHGAECVNVKHNGTDVPSDLYGLVADELVKVLAGVEDPLARSWEGRVTRTLVKLPVMTYVYNAQFKSWKEQLQTVVDAAVDNSFGDVTSYKACAWLCPYLKTAITNVVSAGTVGMEYLLSVGKVFGKAGLGITYVNPVGFTFSQTYLKTTSFTVDITYGGVRRQMRLRADTKEVNASRQSTALAANLVHSLDGSLIVRGVNIASDQGIEQFSVIHDSFGCPAAHVDVLSQCVRAAYAEIMSPNVLQDFSDQVSQALPEGTEMPAIPAMGTLDVSVVNESIYFVS